MASRPPSSNVTRVAANMASPPHRGRSAKNSAKERLKNQAEEEDNGNRGLDVTEPVRKELTKQSSFRFGDQNIRNIAGPQDKDLYKQAIHTSVGPFVAVVTTVNGHEKTFKPKQVLQMDVKNISRIWYGPESNTNRSVYRNFEEFKKLHPDDLVPNSDTKRNQIPSKGTERKREEETPPPKRLEFSDKCPDGRTNKPCSSSVSPIKIPTISKFPEFPDQFNSPTEGEVDASNCRNKRSFKSKNINWEINPSKRRRKVIKEEQQCVKKSPPDICRKIWGKKLSQLRQLQAENESLKKKMDSEQKENARLKQNIETNAQKQKQRDEEFEEKIKSLEEQLISSQKENERLEQCIYKKTQEQEQRKEKFEALKKELALKKENEHILKIKERMIESQKNELREFRKLHEDMVLDDENSQLE